MEAYCERQGKHVGSVRFLYDGERIQPTNTPNEVWLHSNVLNVLFLRDVVLISKVCMQMNGSTDKLTLFQQL